MEVRENLIRLCEKINDGHYKITPDCAEYKVFEQWITDEQIAVMLALKSMKPSFVPMIAKKAGLSVKRTREVLHEITDIGLVVQVLVKKVGLEIYLLPPYTPGIFEFLLINEKFCLAHPEVAYAFHQHATTSQIEHAPNTPMGSGIMRVIPVESAIPADAQKIDNERCSMYIEANEGHLSVTPCQCRRVRKLMGEGSGDMDEGLCVFMGHVGDMFNNTGKGRPVSVEEAKALIKLADERGCVHQITTLHQGETFAICNCMPESCLALGVTQYYNTPATSKSNYVAEIDKEKCVACGQCTDRCANNAIQMGQKLCAKTPIVHPRKELPDDIEWTPEHWNPEHRTNREYIAPEGTAPCKTACPAHIAVQGYIKLAAQGRYLDALELIKKENPLPAVCGRVCNRKCEDVCTRGDVDQAIAIDEIKKFIADRELDRDTRFVPKKLYDFSDKKIAIIGAGPAGLSCAYFLAADNYKVTVFDRNDQPGGMLRYGIPSFRLERNVLDAEIDVLKELGVIFRCGVEIGKDITIQQLREQGFDAIYLAVGAQKSASLGIPGEDLKGVWGGIDFLREVNAGARPAIGKKVVVVGGGNVAMDVARSAVRLGAKSVTIAYRRRKDDMTALREEVDGAVADGCEIMELHAPVKVEKTEDGKVAAMWLQPQIVGPVEWGRPKPVNANVPPVRVPCDRVLVAIGQGIDSKPFGDAGLPVNRGRIKAADTGAVTGCDGVFSGGDCVTGPATVIKAIAAGKVAAANIDAYLGYHHEIRREVELPPVRFDDHKPCGRVNMMERPAAERVQDFGLMELCMTEEEAMQESGRCLHCDHFGCGAFKGGRSDKW